MTRVFSKILIANRGEIACRIMRTARDMGYSTVAVYSDADADALHVQLADEAVRIGPAPVSESYLSAEAVLAAARQSGADAVHPGYGFLSENAGFARACASAGLVFIGPAADAIDAMGDKAAAKRLMIAAGVPCVPGYQGEDQSDETLLREMTNIGFPVMVKASAGGGGRGMRLVAEPGDAAQAIASARSEAQNAFGSGTLILEKAILNARHVEIQIFGDAHGNAVHLGERDCSVQRRHQKVIEESPSPAVDSALREKMGAAAVAAARAIAYQGAGTVEFLLDASGAFYFLEMNTRLQVEHPVTEKVTGLDLVEWQLRIAAGEPLPLTQEQVRFEGHAIEVRLYAEDPAQNFLPQSGVIVQWQPPHGKGVRVDHGIASGQSVSPYYDPMIAKVIVYGDTREEARRRLVRALRHTVLFGLADNRAFLIAMLEHPAFIAGEATTGFIPDHFSGGHMALALRKPDLLWLGVAAALIHSAQAQRSRGLVSTWDSTGIVAHRLRLALGDNVYGLALSALGGGTYTSVAGEESVTLSLLAQKDGVARILCAGMQSDARYVFAGDELYLDYNGLCAGISDMTRVTQKAGEAAGDGQLLAPMNGRIVAVLAKAGDAVKKGQTLIVLEAMKMQHEISAGRDGLVDMVAVSEGDQVATRKVLAALAPVAAE